MTTIVTERPHHCTIKIYHGEDWHDAVPQLVDPRDGSPFDVTNVTLELFCRPSFNHATRFLLATSVASAGIIKDGAALGLISFFKTQAAVEAALPISSGIGWKQFLRMTFTDAQLGEITKHIWVGPLLVFPARDTA